MHFGDREMKHAWTLSILLYSAALLGASATLQTVEEDRGWIYNSYTLVTNDGARFEVQSGDFNQSDWKAGDSITKVRHSDYETGEFLLCNQSSNASARAIQIN